MRNNKLGFTRELFWGNVRLIMQLYSEFSLFLFLLFSFFFIIFKNNSVRPYIRTMVNNKIFVFISILILRLSQSFWPNPKLKYNLQEFSVVYFNFRSIIKSFFLCLIKINSFTNWFLVYKISWIKKKK